MGRDESPHTCSLSLVFLLALTYHGRPLPWNMHEGLPTMNSRNIKLDSQKLAEFCRRHRIRRLSLFGSVLRDDFGHESDTDILVAFKDGADWGFWIMSGCSMSFRKFCTGKLIS